MSNDDLVNFEDPIAAVRKSRNGLTMYIRATVIVVVMLSVLAIACKSSDQPAEPVVQVLKDATADEAAKVNEPTVGAIVGGQTVPVGIEALPPLPVMTLGYQNGVIEGTQINFCWPMSHAPDTGVVQSVCADAGPPGDLSGGFPVQAGDALTALIESDEPANEMSAYIMTSGRGMMVKFDTLDANGTITIPADLPSGVYVLNLFGQWDEGATSYQFTLSVGSGASSVDTPGSMSVPNLTGAESEGEIVLIAQEPSPGLRAVMEALMFGTLVSDNGCLRVRDMHSDTSHLVIWPPHYQLADDSNRVLNEASETVAVIGLGLRLSGGEVSTHRRIPDKCVGPFWIVGDEVSVVDLKSDLNAPNSTPGPTVPDSVPLGEQDAFLRDAQLYAEDKGVSLEGAMGIIQLQYSNR